MEDFDSKWLPAHNSFTYYLYPQGKLSCISKSVNKTHHSDGCSLCHWYFRIWPTIQETIHKKNYQRWIWGKIKIVVYNQIPYFLIYLPRQLFLFEFTKAWKFHYVSSLDFLLCNKNLNSFLTRWGKLFKEGKLFKGGNYMRKYGSLNSICN